MRSFESNPDNSQSKQVEYKGNLAGMTDEELFEETSKKIWLSAYAANNPISCYHWQCNATYDEWEQRGKTQRYADAHKQQMRACGY